MADYLDSFKAIELNLSICHKYGLAGEDIGKHTELITELFFKRLDFSALVPKIKEIFKFDDAKAKKMAADVVGIRLLVVDDWFGHQASAYLQTLGVAPSAYQKIIEDQIAAVKLEKEEDRKDALEARTEKEALAKEAAAPVAAAETEEAIPEDFKINWDEEAKDNVDNFRQGLADILAYGVDTDEYNQMLVALLTERGQAYQGELERAVLGNEEKLTTAAFSLDGKPAAPTIANWLKYFIKEKGSAMFDNIVLTNFLTNSANARGLIQSEKDILKKLLILYRNVKFFPQSMPNDSGEGWEIIPSVSGAPGLEKARTVKAPVTNDVAIKPRRVVEAEAAKSVEDGKKMEELKVIAARYPEKSLQRKAVESEIKKVSKK